MFKRIYPVLIILGMLSLLSASVFAETAKPKTEARLLWVSRWFYSNEAEVRNVIAKTKENGFNAIIFQVRGNGTVYYKSQYEPMDDSVGGDTAAWDPLAVAVDEAHKQGIQIHAWVNTFPGWSGRKPPKNPNQLWNAHPEWFCVDRDGKKMESVGEYAVLSPGIPAVQDHIYNTLMEIVKNYDVDGLHLDYVRYFGPQFSYDSISLERFNAEYHGTPGELPEEWSDWRRQQVTDLVKRLHDGVLAAKPSCAFSASVWGDWDEGYSGYLQNSHAWLSKGYLDFMCPMTYTHDVETYETWNKAHMANTHGRYVFPAIGFFTMKDMKPMLEEMDFNRKYPNLDGTVGYTFFDWTGLYRKDKSGKDQPTDMQKYLKEVGFKEKAEFPTYPWSARKEADIVGPQITKVKVNPPVLQAGTPFNITATVEDESGIALNKDGQPDVQLIYSDKYFIPHFTWDEKNGVTIKTDSRPLGIVPMKPIPGTNQFITANPLTGKKAMHPYYYKVIARDKNSNLNDSELGSIQFFHNSGAYKFSGVLAEGMIVPQFITLDKKNRVWVCELKYSRLRVFEPDGTELPFSRMSIVQNSAGKDVVMTSPSGMGIDPDGFIYAAFGASTDAYVGKFDPNTGACVTTLAVKYSPGDVTFDKFGNMYQTDRIKAKIHVYDKSLKEYKGSPYSYDTVVPGRINRGIAITPDGKKIYVISESKRRVLKFTGKIEKDEFICKDAGTLTDVLDAAGSVDIDSQGNIYVSDFGNQCIQVFDKSERRIADLVGGNPAIQYPRGVMATPDGKTVYIVDMGSGKGAGKILKWTKQ